MAKLTIFLFTLLALFATSAIAQCEYLTKGQSGSFVSGYVGLAAYEWGSNEKGFGVEVGLLSSDVAFALGFASSKNGWGTTTTAASVSLTYFGKADSLVRPIRGFAGIGLGKGSISGAGSGLYSTQLSFGLICNPFPRTNSLCIGAQLAELSLGEKITSFDYVSVTLAGNLEYAAHIGGSTVPFSVGVARDFAHHFTTYTIGLRAIFVGGEKQ